MRPPPSPGPARPTRTRVRGEWGLARETVVPTSGLILGPVRYRPNAAKVKGQAGLSPAPPTKRDL